MSTKRSVSRRRFLVTAAAGSAVAAARPSRAGTRVPRQSSTGGHVPARPALLGGDPVRRTAFPSWPVADTREEQALADLIRSGGWFRGEKVAAFEAAYASLTGSKHCLATANGTSALITSLAALGIGVGDVVIVPPYTFVATVNAVLLLHALPVFVDSDRETFQSDARKVEAAATPRTRAIIPVHLGGAVAWREQNRCPENDRLCGEAVWLTQTMLLGPRRDMDEIAAAVRKVQASAAALARA